MDEHLDGNGEGDGDNDKDGKGRPKLSEAEKAAIRDEIREAISRVVDSGRFLHGPDVEKLEARIAEVCQTKHAISCASGSDALLLALMALDLGPEAEVVVPSFTFFATASCVWRLGCKIVFADIDPRTYNVTEESVAAVTTSRTRAIIPVHLFGQCSQIDRICRFGAERGLAVIEDAAQAIGSAYNGRSASRKSEKSAPRRRPWTVADGPRSGCMKIVRIRKPESARARPLFHASR
ncbi:MAG: DegT/DnrJ/EryC1/StrS family aminotransferase, partial [bacterium]